MSHKKVERVVLIVLDSVGIGELPDAENFGDVGSHTLRNTALHVGGLDLPFLSSLGLGNITECLDDKIPGVPPVPKPLGAFGRMAEKSVGKDTIMGHWEIAGLTTPIPFPLYPDGFPPEIVNAFESAIGTKVLGNKSASGTKIIAELGEKHVSTGYPIIYTSADSVFQIAAHEEVIPVPKLYQICLIARELLKGEHNIGRVIARPFVGSAGEFSRTNRRKDFSVQPHGKTLLDFIKDAGLDVIGVGKIQDIFASKGLTHSEPASNNRETMAKILKLLGQDNKGLIFANFIDFDMLFGHRRDPNGYAKSLEEFDRMAKTLSQSLAKTDVIAITADHGCDPTMPGSDHTREHVPLLMFGGPIKTGINLGTRASFADLGKTIGDLLDVDADLQGTSFKQHIL